METQYKRKLNKSYMILYGSAQTPEYQLAMLQNGQPEGLLSMQVVRGQEMTQYRYDITGYQSLDTVLQGNSLRKELLEQILSQLALTLERLSCYLLEEERILLFPEYIFCNLREQRVSYCYCLAQEKEKNGSVKELLEYLLAHLDHSDSRAVKMAYELYQSVVEEQGSLSAMLHEARLHKDEPMVTAMEQQEMCTVRETESSSVPFQKVPSQERIQFCNSTMLQQAEYAQNNGDIRDVSYGNERETASEFLSRNVDCNDAVCRKNEDIATEKPRKHVRWNQVAEQITYQQEIPKKEKKKEKLHLPLFSGFRKKKSKRTESARSLLKSKRTQEQSYLFEPTDMLPQQEEQRTVYLGTREQNRQGCLQYEGEGNETDILLDREVYLIGSRPNDVDGVLHANTISRMHAQITKMPDGYYLEDLNSMNGTTVNGHLLDYKERVKLKQGDEICFASERFRFIS